ncbi:putative MFS family arabinose efflux permease [Bradyrhizobium japonicum]
MTDPRGLRCIQLRADIDTLRAILRRSRLAGRDIGRFARHDRGVRSDRYDRIGTIGSGWLSDRYDNRWLLAIYYGFRGLALIWLVESNATLGAMSAFAILYGLDFIATVPPTVKLTVGTFGREMGPVVFGWIFAAHQLGVGLMAFAAGVSRDTLGTYVPAFLLAGVLCLLAAAAFALVKGPAVPAPA